MNRSLVCLAMLGLGGCPPPPRYIVTDVTAANVPLNDALVALHCGRKDRAEAALRTDDTGRARLPVTGDVAIEKCSVTVAKPGFGTTEASGLSLCTNVTACPPILVQLVVLGVVPPDAPQLPVEVRP